MAFYRAFYHLVWSTKYRSALLTNDVEEYAHDVLRAKAIQLGSIVWALNGTETHVHLVVTPPRPMAIPDFVGQVKGVVSYRLNQQVGRSVRFAWQNEYGAFTFDEKRLPNYVRYVERQKEHHAQNQVIPILERTDEDESSSGRLRETQTIYNLPVGLDEGDMEWWRDMVALG